MAAVPTVLHENGSGTDGTSFTTGSFTITAGRLILLSVYNGLVGGAGAPTVTGQSQTWEQVTTATRGNCRVTVFRCRPTSNQTGTLTINFSAAQSNCLWQAVSWAGIDTSGTNGSGAIRQTEIANAFSAAPSVTLPNATDNPAGNATYGAFFYNSLSTESAPGEGFVNLGSIHTTFTSFGSPSIRAVSIWDDGTRRTINATLSHADGGTENWAIVGIEVKAAAANIAVTNAGNISSAQEFYRPQVNLAGTVLPITYRSQSSAAGDHVNQLFVDAPPGLQAGDFMLAVVGMSADLTISSVPADWKFARTDVTNTGGNTGYRQSVYWKKATSSDVPNETVTPVFIWGFSANTGDCAIIIVAYNGVNTDTPFDASLDGVGLIDDGATSTSIDTPTQTTTTTGDVLVVASGANPQVTTGGWGDPVLALNSGVEFGEGSGLAASPKGGVWAIRDSGNEKGLFWLTQTSRAHFAHRYIDVTGISNSDYEDVYYTNDGFVWIHDNVFSSNQTTPHRLHKITEPTTPGSATSATLVATYYWDFPYGGEADSNVQGSGQHPHNCEAIAIYGGRLYGILKNSNAPSLVYDFGPTGSLSTNSGSPTFGTRVGTINHSSPSSFAISNDGKMAITVSHQRVKVWQAKTAGFPGLLDGNNTLVYERQSTDAEATNFEGATFFPHGTSNFIAISEDKTVGDWQGSISLATITAPAGMTERANVTVSSGTTQRTVIEVADLSVATSATATGQKTGTLTDGGRNIGQGFLLLASNQTAPTGPPQFIDLRDKIIVTTPGGDDETPHGTGLNSCMLGWWPGAWAEMAGGTGWTGPTDEDILGKKFAVFRGYSQWDETSSLVQRALDRGMLVLSSHKPPKVVGSWGKIANGDYDTRLIQLAKQYKGYGKEIVFIFHHEPHDQCHSVKGGLQTTNPDGDNFSYGTAAEYRNAWAKIHTIFDQQGATNVKMGYTAVGNWWAVREDKGQVPDTLFPGASIIDVFTHDDYNEYHAQMWTKDKATGQLVKSGNKTNDWKEFEVKFLPLVELCEKYQRPLIIGEFGSDTTKDGHSIDDWFRKAGIWIQTHPLAKKWLIGFCYFHSPPPTVNYQFTRGAFAPVGVAGWKDAFTRDEDTGENRAYFVSIPRAVAPNTGAAPTPDPDPEETTTIISYSIPTSEAFGRPTVRFTTGPQFVNVTESIPSAEEFGYHTVRLVGTHYVTNAGGIFSGEAFGRPTLYTADIPVDTGMPLNSRPHALVAIQAASTQVVRRAEIFHSDGETPWLDKPADILDGSVSISADRDERRTLDITFDNGEGKLDSKPGGFWYDKIIKVWRGVDYGAAEPYWHQLGEFVIDSIESQHFPHTVHITGRDYTKKLMQSKFQHTTRFPPGQTIDQIVETVARNGGITKLNIDRTPPGTTGYPPVNSIKDEVRFERGDDRWKSIKDLAAIFGFDLFFDRLGYLTMELFVDPSKDPTFTFEIGANSNLISYSRHTNDSRLFNVLVVVGGSATHDITSSADPLAPFGRAANEQPNSPTSVANIGERTYQITDSRLVNDDQCQDLAERLLPVYALEEFEMTFTSLVIPWLDVNEVVFFQNPDNPDDPPYFLLREVDIPLTLGPMSSTGKRITKVI